MPVFLLAKAFFFLKIYVPSLIRSDHSDGLEKQLDFDNGRSVAEKKKKKGNYCYKQHLSLVRL